MVRSPSYAMETVTEECQPGTVREVLSDPGALVRADGDFSASVPSAGRNSAEGFKP